MSERYILSNRDLRVVQAMERLLKRLVRSEVLKPAQLVSVAKVLHVLSHLPRVNENVCVAVELAYHTERSGGSSSSIWRLSVGSDLLDLSVGGWDCSDAVGTDSHTTMSWTVQPGERPEFNGSWDDDWMQNCDDGGVGVYAEDFRGCSVSIEDDDNDLLYELEPPEGDNVDPDPWIEVYRDGEAIKLTLSEWHAAIRQFEESGWEPAENIETYSSPGISIGAEDGAGMQKAGDLMWRFIDRTPVLAESIGLNIELFISLVRFAGRGQFNVRKVGEEESE